MRVDWRGREQSKDRFDVSSRIIAYAQFEKSLSTHLPKLNQGLFKSLIYLQPMSKDGKKQNTMKEQVKPVNFKLKHDADNTLVLTFSPNTLEQNQCYKLMFSSELESQ